MKRILAFLLIVTLLLPLVACGGGTSLVTEETETATAATANTETEDKGVHEVTGFCAGFGRGVTTPTSSVPLAGYGATSYRMSSNIMDDLYCTCVALQDEDGERLLFFQFDQIGLSLEFGEPVRNMVSKATGVPGDHILLNATHTHSGPDTSSSSDGTAVWRANAWKAAVKAAEDAVADLDTCSIYIGTQETHNLNFVRRYYLENGFTTPNATYGTGKVVAHECEVDGDIRFVKFDRKNQKGIVIANWQCHATMTGGSSKPDISSDFVGQFRHYVEKDQDLYFLYLQGGAGNVNPSTKLPGEENPYSRYNTKGKALSNALAEGLQNAVETPAGKIRAMKTEIEGTYTHEDQDKLEIAKQVKELFSANKRSEASALAIANGISSAYEASAIVGRAGRGETGVIPLYAYAFGDVGVVTAPFEMFCNVYRDLRAVSPFALTLTCGYANGSQGYMPAAESFPNKGYEVVTCKYVQGTAEQITAKQLEMLEELKAK